MDIRFQYILLKAKAATLCAACLFAPVALAVDSATDVQPAQKSGSDINNEVFELGVFGGIINIEDFGSGFVPGISATFRASEDFFIQYNYLQTSVALSAYEKGQHIKFSDSRKLTHYDLLVGYNLFQGEFFPSENNAELSSLYLMAGVGDTEFGGESNMTYTIGAGYQVSLTRKIALCFDFKDYIYKSSLVLDKERSVSATQISSGLKFSF